MGTTMSGSDVRETEHQFFITLSGLKPKGAKSMGYFQNNMSVFFIIWF